MGGQCEKWKRHCFRSIKTAKGNEKGSGEGESAGRKNVTLVRLSGTKGHRTRDLLEVLDVTAREVAMSGGEAKGDSSQST